MPTEQSWETLHKTEGWAESHQHPKMGSCRDDPQTQVRAHLLHFCRARQQDNLFSTSHLHVCADRCLEAVCEDLRLNDIRTNSGWLIPCVEAEESHVVQPNCSNLREVSCPRALAGSLPWHLWALALSHVLLAFGERLFLKHLCGSISLLCLFREILRYLRTSPRARTSLGFLARGWGSSEQEFQIKHYHTQCANAVSSSGVPGFFLFLKLWWRC